MKVYWFSALSGGQTNVLLYFAPLRQLFHCLLSLVRRSLITLPPMWLLVLVRHLTQQSAPQDVMHSVREGNPSPLHDMPDFVLAILALGCLVMAAAVAGLTLGLMSLDSTSLDIVIQGTDEKQAEAARQIKPIREQGNLLLVTLLLSNTLAAELLPLVLEALVPGGYFSLIVSVLSLMIFGEMIPQAFCSRHPLYFGARLIGFVKVLRFILYPISMPIAFALDYVLGEELGTIYNREELKGLIDVHAKSKVLTHDETTILKAALEFSLKTVEQIMTPAENVFKLDIDSILDRDTLLRILRSGHSRIPLYDESAHNIVCLLLVKQLVLVNPDDRIPIRAIISKRTSNHKVRVAPALECSATTLIADILNEFQQGCSHMAIVYDDVLKPMEEREFLGIVSIEDVIEEILMEEIVDETDMYTDNTNKTKVLVRGADGMLMRATTVANQRSPSMNKASTSDRTLRMREIDVPALRAPLTEGLLVKPSGDVRLAIPIENGMNSASTSMPSLERELESNPGSGSKDGWTDINTGDRYAESRVLLRQSVDNVTGENQNKVPIKQIGPFGPVFGGIARRSMMSLLGDEDNVMPEDVATAETHRGTATAPHTPTRAGKECSREGKIKMVMRPLPSNASSERAEIPVRLRRKESKRAETPRKRENNPSYGSTANSTSS